MNAMMIILAHVTTMQNVKIFLEAMYVLVWKDILEMDINVPVIIFNIQNFCNATKNI